jgi:ribose 5-phosphate isomerase A
MQLSEQHIAAMVERYVKNGDVVAIGTSKLGESFVKKLALKIERDGHKIKFIPTSIRLAEIASEMGIECVSIDEYEIDLAIEFADKVDEHFNFIKKDSASLVRDKMIAQSAKNLILICEENNYVKRLSGTIPFEISSFGHMRTLHQLESFGRAKLRRTQNRIYKTESNNYVVDVEINRIHNLHDLEHAGKDIPGVLETGLFLGYADTVMLAGKEKITVKSRLTNK